jgi:uncharacterized phiE125 gp8 family phage protein
MPSFLLVPPAAEPITLAEAKAYLRVEHGDDDTVIAALIAAARSHVEAATRRALITQSWRLVLHRWPVGGRIPVTPVPLQQLLAARIHRADGTSQAIDAAAFTLDRAAAPAILGFAPGSMPAPGRDLAGIEIDVEVGYGGAGTDVPEPLRQAMRLLIAHWYENRGLVAGDAGAVLPAGVAALLAPYRVLAP